MQSKCSRGHQLRKLKANLCNLAQQLSFQDVFALLVLLTALECLVILPSNCLVALLTRNVSYDMASCGHVPLGGLTLNHVDNGIEEVGLAVLAAEVLQKIAVSTIAGLAGS